MKKLKNGWGQGSAQEFLELSDADMAYIETKRDLAACLREQRLKRHLTQTELAARLETRQFRVANWPRCSELGTSGQRRVCGPGDL